MLHMPVAWRTARSPSVYFCLALLPSPVLLTAFCHFCRAAGAVLALPLAFSLPPLTLVLFRWALLPIGMRITALPRKPPGGCRVHPYPHMVAFIFAFVSVLIQECSIISCSLRYLFIYLPADVVRLE
jgi:hypothetical protein